MPVYHIMTQIFIIKYIIKLNDRLIEINIKIKIYKHIKFDLYDN